MQLVTCKMTTINNIVNTTTSIMTGGGWPLPNPMPPLPPSPSSSSPSRLFPDNTAYLQPQSMNSCKMAAINKIIDATNVMTGGMVWVRPGSNSGSSSGSGSGSNPYPLDTYEPSRPWLDCIGGDIASNKYTGTINHCKDWAIHDVGGDALLWNGQTCIAKHKSNVGKCRVQNGWQYYTYDKETNSMNPLR